MGLGEKFEPVAEIIDHKVELKGGIIFGEVKSGWLKLKAPLVPLILDPRVDPDGTGVPYENNPKVRTEKGDPEGDHSRFDFAFTSSTGREEGLAMVESLKDVNIYALVLTKILPQDGRELGYCALIVRPAKNDSTAMERVGFFFMSPELLGECSQLDHEEGRLIVTLV